MIEAVLFDLDDTLFDQRRWLAGAWLAVAAAAGAWGVDVGLLRATLADVAGEGSARGDIIDRSLERIGATHVPVAPLVDAFKSFRSPALEPYAGVAPALARLRRRVPLALVTDGDVGVQTDKLVALGLASSFDAVVYSDRLGRAKRKPDRAPFDEARRLVGAGAAATVHVGDHPRKDVWGATRAGLRAVRVLTGEYRAAPDIVKPWFVVPAARAAVQLLEQLVVSGA